MALFQPLLVALRIDILASHLSVLMAFPLSHLFTIFYELILMKNFSIPPEQKYEFCAVL